MSTQESHSQKDRRTTPSPRASSGSGLDPRDRVWAAAILISVTLLAAANGQTQSSAPPADFKVNVLLVQSANDLKKWLDAPAEEQARSGKLRTLKLGEMLGAVIVVEGYRSKSNQIDLTVDCQWFGPDGKLIRRDRNCIATANSGFVSANTVVIAPNGVFRYEATDAPGIYRFRAKVTDPANGTPVTVEEQFRLVGSSAPAERTSPQPTESVNAGNQPAQTQEETARQLLAKIRSGEALEQSRTDARRAVQLAPNMSEAHLALGNILAAHVECVPGLLDSQDAVSEYRKAIQLDPKNAEPHAALGSFLARCHDYQGALSEDSKALQLDPKNDKYQLEFDYANAQINIEMRRRAAVAAAQARPAGNAARPYSPPTSHGGIGARFGTRDPVTCPSTREPVNGPISVEQATLYFICSREGTRGGPLDLVENLTLEVGKGRPASYVDSSDIDHDSLVYPIRGSFTMYTCYTPKASPYPYLNNIGRNCHTNDEPQATGTCYRTTFGDWRCSMVDAGIHNYRDNVPPPRD